MSATTWTDQRVELLRALWAEGRSAAQIARTLGGGVTRNAVIGKIHRLGLSGRPQPARPRRRASAAPPARAEAPVARPRPTRPSSKSAARRSEGAAPAFEGRGLATVLTIRAGACRWPLGEPGSEAFSFCGRSATRGAYCAQHGAAAYRGFACDGPGADRSWSAGAG